MVIPIRQLVVKPSISLPDFVQRFTLENVKRLADNRNGLREKDRSKTIFLAERPHTSKVVIMSQSEFLGRAMVCDKLKVLGTVVPHECVIIE